MVGQRLLNVRRGWVFRLLATVILFTFAPAAKSQTRAQPDSTLDSRSAEVKNLSSEINTLKKDPDKSTLEKHKLEQEVEKLRMEVATLRSSASFPGQFIPWLQVLGLGSLIGGVLVLLAGKSLSSVQKQKLEQDLQFAQEDHALQQKKLEQDMETTRETHALQGRKLQQDIGISRSQHTLKLFEALGSTEPRVRIGAASELGQRVRELNEQLSWADLSSTDRIAHDRERQAIIRVLIAVTKHEEREELQKHIADLLVDIIGARNVTATTSPLAAYDFQGARLANAWWKGVNATGVDFYRASLPRAGLAESRLSNAVFKGADLTGATLRQAVAERTNFAGADLSGVKAQEAVFRGANLTGARVEGADFRNADFTGARIEGVDFSKATVEGALLQHEPERPQPGTVSD